MDVLRYTFHSDGSSDRALMPHLNWLLRQNGVQRDILPTWADLRYLPNVPKGLSERIRVSLELYPCDLLFIHRDTERDTYINRKNEILNALELLAGQIDTLPFVCVIPMRMQEAWMLFDINAIRSASGNPNGREAISLPRLNSIEAKPDPKQILFELLERASGLSGRRLRSFNHRHSANQVSSYIEDFSPLRVLPTFAQLESDIADVIIENGWNV